MRIRAAVCFLPTQSKGKAQAPKSSPLISFHTTSPSSHEIEATILPEVQHVQHVAVEYFRRSDDVMCGHDDAIIAEPCDLGWIAFADLVSNLPCLHSVVFVFASQEDADTFVVKNDTALLRLQEFITTKVAYVRESGLKLETRRFYSGTSSLDILVCSYPLHRVCGLTSGSTELSKYFIGTPFLGVTVCSYSLTHAHDLASNILQGCVTPITQPIRAAIRSLSSLRERRRFNSSVKSWVACAHLDACQSCFALACMTSASVALLC